MVSVAHHRDIVVIGASAGGVRAALSLVERLPRDLPASLLIVIHLAAAHKSTLPELLSSMGGLPAAHALDGELLKQGKIYVAAPDMHLFVRPNGSLGVVRGPKENGHRPSIDMLFRTAAATFGPRVIGIVLSGYMDSGTTGLLSIKARGGVAIAQDPLEAEVPFMPRSAIEMGQADHVAKVGRIAELIGQLGCETVASVDAGPHIQHQAFAEQGESVERALWAGVRALEEAANLTQRVAVKAPSGLKQQLEEKSGDQREQAAIIRGLLLKGVRLTDRRLPLKSRAPSPTPVRLLRRHSRSP